MLPTPPLTGDALALLSRHDTPPLNRSHLAAHPSINDKRFPQCEGCRCFHVTYALSCRAPRQFSPIIFLCHGVHGRKTTRHRARGATAGRHKCRAADAVITASRTSPAHPTSVVFVTRLRTPLTSTPKPTHWPLRKPPRAPRFRFAAYASHRFLCSPLLPRLIGSPSPSSNVVSLRKTLTAIIQPW